MNHIYDKEKLTICALICVVLTALFIPFGAAPTNIFSIGAIVFWLAGADIRSDLAVLLEKKFLFFLLAFLLLVILSVLWNRGTWHSYFSELRNYRRFLFFIVVYLLVRNHPLWQKVILATFFVSTSVLVIWCICIYFGVPYIPKGHGYTGEAIFHKSYIAQGLLCACNIVLGINYAVFSKNWGARFFAGLMACLSIVVTLFMTSGRTGYVCVLVSLFSAAVFWGWRNKKVLAVGLIGCCLAFALGLTSSKVQVRIQHAKADVTGFMAGNMNSSMGVRFYWWGTSLNIIKANPVLGVGCGALKSVSPHYAYGKDKKVQISPELMVIENPHQDYLFVFTQYGFLGFALWMCFLWGVFKTSWQCAPPNRWMTFGILSAYLVGCFFNSFSRDITECSAFVLLIASLIAEMPLKADT